MSTRTLGSTASSGRMSNSQYDQKSSASTPQSSAPSPADAVDPNYVNVGYEHWLQVRRQWKSASAPAPSGSSRARQVDPDDIADRLFRTNNGVVHLPYPVPLGQMVEILMDAWEAEGLYG